jgi:hypothetical protein
VWHERLAHQNYRYVREFLKRNTIKYEGEEEQCVSCMKGKQHRFSVGNSNSKVNNPGELMHMDLCGPMETDSLGGSKYFLLIKDDYSNYRFVYFLKYKAEAKNKIKEFITYFEKDTGFAIKIIRSDNGKEFINKDSESLFVNNGIVHQRSVAYTPEQNGKVEREMRTVVESARTMMQAKNLEKKLWAEAVNTAVFTINRTGSSKISHKTPYELLYKKTFNIEFLQTFGNEVYVHIAKQKRLKWDAKSEQGIFCWIWYKL